MRVQEAIEVAERMTGDASGSRWWADTPPHGTWRSWEEAFATPDAEATLAHHAELLTVPRRLAGTFVSSAVLCTFAQLQAICLTVLRCGLSFRPSELRIDVSDGRIRHRLGLPAARLVPADVAADSGIDDLIEHCVRDLSIGGRVSVRVVACDAAFAWLAGIRAGLPPEQRSRARDILRSQWRSRFKLDDLVIEQRVPVGAERVDHYFSRTACCLEYHGARAGQRTYCPSCPLVPTEAIVARRAAVLRGEHPRPFDDRDRPRRQRSIRRRATDFSRNDRS